jgi:hypothetical protein
MEFKWITFGTSVPLPGCRLQHNIAPSGNQTNFANGKRNEGSGGRTAAGQQPHIGGNEINAMGRRERNQQRQAWGHRNVRARTMDLSVQEQGHRALMAGSSGILMRPQMQGGHRRQNLDQEEDTEAERTDAAVGGAHQPSGGRWHHDHGREYETAAASMSTSFFCHHSPMILTSTRLRRPPSNSP